MANIYNLLIFTLSALFLAQVFCQYPVSRNDIWDAEISKEERNKLIFFTLIEYSDLANYTLMQGKTLFNSVLRETSVLKTMGAKLREHLDSFTQFVEKVERLEEKNNIDTLIELFDLVVEFGDITQRFTATAMENPSIEDLLLKISLQKHGLEQLKKTFAERFEDFSRKFCREMEAYVNNLSEEQQRSAHRMLDWYKEFKDENNVDRKLKIFGKLVDFYEKDV